MENKLTDKDWVILTEKTIKIHNQGLRLGQAYMTALRGVNRKLYYEITDSDNDCFYDDNKIINFIKALI